MDDVTAQRLNIFEPPPAFGPEYPNMGPRVAKFRRIPKRKLTAAQKREYAEAIETKILSLQRQSLQRELPTFKPRCPSGTWHNNADGKIGKAIREQQRNALLAYPEQARRARTPQQWQDMYEAAMAEKDRAKRQRKNDHPMDNSAHRIVPKGRRQRK